MSYDDLDRNDIVCEQCGAGNPSGSTYCESCGSRLNASRQSETIIDVSSDRPRIVTVKDDITETGPFGRVRTIRFDQGRVVVARGGSRTCLLIVAVMILLLGCMCWAIWTSVSSIV